MIFDVVQGREEDLGRDWGSGRRRVDVVLSRSGVSHGDVEVDFWSGGGFDCGWEGRRSRGGEGDVGGGLVGQDTGEGRNSWVVEVAEGLR